MYEAEYHAIIQPHALYHAKKWYLTVWNCLTNCLPYDGMMEFPYTRAGKNFYGVFFSRARV